MFEAECVGPEEIRLKIFYGDEGWSLSFSMKVEQARRLAAKLVVAAERAESLERDMRAPG